MNGSQLFGAVNVAFLSLINSRAFGSVTVPPATTGSPTFTDDQGEYDFDYDFTRDGGVQGTLALTPRNGSKGALPAGFVIVAVFKEIITSLDSASHTAQGALTSGESAGDIKAATIVSNAYWTTHGHGVAKAQMFTETTTPRTPSLVITVEDLTAGKFTLHFDGYTAP